MRLRADSSELRREAEAARAYGSKFVGRVKVRVMAKSLKVIGQVKIAMPVDTGAARARWGTPGAAGGLWDVLDGGLTIIQGAQLDPHEYIIELNEGSSMQAPAGFIDTIAYKAEEELDQEIAQDAADTFT